jgi:antitoxin ParD1/3/4/toxin ParE1/3/4
MKRYLLTAAAREDLWGIDEYIRRSSPAAAQRVNREFRDAFRKLAIHPEIGHTRCDLVGEPVRFWPVYSYLIVYRFDARPLLILRVLHGARDVTSIFEEGF